MADEIAHICKNIPKRGPGDEGEKIACEYMADVLKNDCGCERADVESFKENPHSFLGWIYFTITFALAGMILFFFMPALGAALIALGFFIMVVQFGMYKKLIDGFFPEKPDTTLLLSRNAPAKSRREFSSTVTPTQRGTGPSTTNSAARFTKDTSLSAFSAH